MEFERECVDEFLSFQCRESVSVRMRERDVGSSEVALPAEGWVVQGHIWTSDKELKEVGLDDPALPQ